MLKDYYSYLDAKSQCVSGSGIDPGDMNKSMFDFQKDLVSQALSNGRFGIFADCGMGKTLMQLEWARQISEHEKKPVLIITPLAVSQQTVKEAEKFGVECTQSRDGTVYPITITNYEMIDKFNQDDFIGVICDESSILKNYSGSYRKTITEFMKKKKYRLLTTATAAPNDYIELGTSSEALGYMGHIDMLNRFFKNENNNIGLRRRYGEAPKWNLKPHAETHFWRWVSSWARAIRKPSDFGYDDGDFILPPLHKNVHVVESTKLPDGMLFPLPARDLREQRAEARSSMHERCEMAAAIANNTTDPVILWCQLNDEGDLLERMIPDAIQVKGSDGYESKEHKLVSFANNQERVLITKPKIGAWGLNLQHCNRVVYFPSHSYEQYYQAVRRCWRFGQKRPVTVDVIMTEGQRKILDNLDRKSAQALRMFESLIDHMNDSLKINEIDNNNKKEELPSWL